MKRKICFVIFVLLIFCAAVNHVMSDDAEQKDRLEGNWEGALCFSAPEGDRMKYMCEKMTIQFVQTGERFIANGVLSSHGSLTFEGMTTDNIFYGTYAGAVPSSADRKEYGITRGFINGNTLQVIIDHYVFTGNTTMWMHGGIATLQKKEEK